MDETCSYAAPEGIYEKISYGVALPYSSESLVANDCVSCAEPTNYDEQNNNDQQDEDAIADVCQRLYVDAGKCESGLDIQYKNTLACDFIETLPQDATRRHVSFSNVNVSAVPAKVLAGVFAGTTVILGAVAFALHKKVQRKNVSLATEGEMA